MNLNHKIVCHELGTAELVEALIKNSFPPDKQEPIEFLLKQEQKPMVNFWAYGAAIIRDVRSIFGGKDMVLHVGDPNESPENAPQRIRRIQFYERLGFKDTGYRLSPTGNTFYLMSTAEDYQISTYMNLMYEYSDGEYTPPVYKEGER